MKRLITRLESVVVRGRTLALATVFVATGFVSIASMGVAHAVGADQFCAGSGANLCLNAWNGGPAINVEGPGAGNNRFTLENSSNPNDVNIEFLGAGSHNGQCIGDYGSESNNARAGLVSGCGTSNVGWGGNFVASVCGSGSNAGLEFSNVHWNGGYLGLQSTSNGSAFYLNQPTPWCFKVSSD